jgi:hypothetical protein
LKHIAKILGGILLVILGLIGLLMPIMPGWALLIPGLILLGDYVPPIRRLLDWAKHKFEEQAGPHLRKYRESPKQPDSGPEPPVA